MWCDSGNHMTTVQPPVWLLFTGNGNTKIYVNIYLCGWPHESFHKINLQEQVYMRPNFSILAVFYVFYIFEA